MQRLIIALALFATSACESKPPEPARFPVTFTANPDAPLAGVEVRIDGGKELGTTGADGSLHVTLTGREGTAVPFRVTCPDGYRPPTEMPALRLRQFTNLDPETAARGIEVTIECPPAEYRAALVVDAGLPDLPVLAQGREVARTNSRGVAHALLSLPPSSTFRVVVDTGERPLLRPQNPETILTVGNADEVFVIDQRFKIDEVVKPEPPRKKRVRRKRVRKKRDDGPRFPVKLE